MLDYIYKECMEENDLDYFNERHEALHGFMGARPQPDDADKLPHFIQHNGVDWCTKMAANYARIDLLKPLVEQYGGDVRQEDKLRSDRHRGDSVSNNLLDEVLTHHLYNPSADTTPEGRARVVETVSYLLEKGLSAGLNKDGMENAVRSAYALAFPARVYDEKRAEYDWILAMDSTPHEAFAEPYQLIEQAQPDVVANLQRSFEIESRRLGMQFAREARGKSGDEGTLERVWGRITKALGFDHS
jgi:hypothetical protein